MNRIKKETVHWSQFLFMFRTCAAHGRFLRMFDFKAVTAMPGGAPTRGRKSLFTLAAHPCMDLRHFGHTPASCPPHGCHPDARRRFACACQRQGGSPPADGQSLFPLAAHPGTLPAHWEILRCPAVFPPTGRFFARPIRMGPALNDSVWWVDPCLLLDGVMNDIRWGTIQVF